MTFYATIRTRTKGDRKDRVHRFYIADVKDEAEARATLRESERLLYQDGSQGTFISEFFEAQEPGPQVISFGVYLADQS